MLIYHFKAFKQPILMISLHTIHTCVCVYIYETKPLRGHWTVHIYVIFHLSCITEMQTDFICKLHVSPLLRCFCPAIPNISGKRTDACKSFEIKWSNIFQLFNSKAICPLFFFIYICVSFHCLYSYSPPCVMIGNIKHFWPSDHQPW